MIEVTPDIKLWIKHLSELGNITVGLHHSIEYEPSLCLSIGYLTIAVILPEHKKEERIAEIYLGDETGDWVMLSQLKYENVISYVDKLYRVFDLISEYSLLGSEE